MSQADALYELMSTTRSIRRIKDTPIPSDVLQRVLQAAVWAPSGGNRQPWRMIVCTERDVKQRLSDIYVDEWASYVDFNMAQVKNAPEEIQQRVASGLSVGTQLAASLADVPAVVIFTFDPNMVYVTDNNLGRTPVVGGGSLYPAVQNLLLAARAEGLGGVLTTLVAAREKDLRDLLGFPEGWGVYAMVPLGYPKGSHGPLRREPLDKMAHFNHWVD